MLAPADPWGGGREGGHACEMRPMVSIHAGVPEETYPLYSAAHSCKDFTSSLESPREASIASHAARPAAMVVK